MKRFAGFTAVVLAVIAVAAPVAALADSDSDYADVPVDQAPSNLASTMFDLGIEVGAVPFNKQGCDGLHRHLSRGDTGRGMSGSRIRIEHLLPKQVELEQYAA